MRQVSGAASNIGFSMYLKLGVYLQTPLTMNYNEERQGGGHVPSQNCPASFQEHFWAPIAPSGK